MARIEFSCWYVTACRSSCNLTGPLETANSELIVVCVGLVRIVKTVARVLAGSGSGRSGEWSASRPLLCSSSPMASRALPGRLSTSEGPVFYRKPSLSGPSLPIITETFPISDTDSDRYSAPSECRRRSRNGVRPAIPTCTFRSIDDSIAELSDPLSRVLVTLGRDVAAVRRDLSILTGSILSYRCCRSRAGADPGSPSPHRSFLLHPPVGDCYDVFCQVTHFFYFFFYRNTFPSVHSLLSLVIECG